MAFLTASSATDAAILSRCLRPISWLASSFGGSKKVDIREPMRKRFFMTDVVTVLLEENGKLLMGRRMLPPSAKRWEFLGGKIEKGESVVEAAAREIREEIGVKINSIEFVTIATSYHKEVGRRFRVFVVKAKIANGDTTIRDPEKIAELGWFPIADLPADSVEGLKKHQSLLVRVFEKPTPL